MLPAPLLCSVRGSLMHYLRPGRAGEQRREKNSEVLLCSYQMFLRKERLVSNFSVTSVSSANNVMTKGIQPRDECETARRRNFKQTLLPPKLREPRARQVAAGREKAHRAGNLKYTYGVLRAEPRSGGGMQHESPLPRNGISRR